MEQQKAMAIEKLSQSMHVGEGFFLKKSYNYFELWTWSESLQKITNQIFFDFYSLEMLINALNRMRLEEMKRKGVYDEA